jgi:hypothetical protein
MTSSFRRAMNLLACARASYLPFERVLTKHLVVPGALPHAAFIERYLATRVVDAAAMTSGYGVAREQRVDDQFMFKPLGPERPLRWWVMPWANLEKPVTFENPDALAQRRAERAVRYARLIDDVVKDGFSWTASGPISAHVLRHPTRGDIALALDGHHRLALLAHLRRVGRQVASHVPLRVKLYVERDLLLEMPAVQGSIAAGDFTPDEAIAVFDACFDACLGPIG